MEYMWYFENTGPQTGVFNMQRDEELARSLCEGTGMPTLRLYAWEPWAISLGWHQSYETIDRERAAADGIDVVRRPTGGRAILHAEELTYCVVFNSGGESIHETYARISEALLTGLRILGVHATFEKQQPHFPSLYRSPMGLPCFSSAGRYEITLNGKKLIGSAQRRYIARDGSEVVLQHGSILIGPAHKNLVQYLAVGESERQRIQLAFEEKTIELETILQRSVSLEEVACAIQRGFEECWNIRFIPEYEHREG